MLDSLGYRILKATDHHEALLLAKEHPGEIHLLLTDVVMPEMNGRDLYTLIGSQRPGIRCLFMSGYTADVIAHHGVLEEGIHFLEKPFTMKTLAIAIRKTLANDMQIDR
jgi:two-component system, cell cycle sensor histidine kinase and response regulator CckA